MMRKTFTVLALCFITPALASATELPHLDPEMTGFEYRALQVHTRSGFTAAPLDRVISYGKRNLDWFEKVNSVRTQPLELWTEANTIAYPVESPMISNESLILERFEKAKKALPPSMRAALDSNGELPTTTGVDDETYLEHARMVDKIYQSASRWMLQSPMLDGYAARQQMDVRAYLILSKDPTSVRRELKSWATLSAARKAELRRHLVQICWNGGTRDIFCGSAIDHDVSQNGHPLASFEKYLPEAKSFYEEQFIIQRARRDIVWSSSDRNTATVPFGQPQSGEVLDWLRDNIEDEWKWKSWGLKLGFRPVLDGSIPYVRFVPGATANVNGLAGNRITMDANRSIHHYSSRWTIRHEFGHVLGFPDCYIEFYDSAAETMVNYQLDVSNIMCSRRGKLKEIHFKEMERAYFKSR